MLYFFVVEARRTPQKVASSNDNDNLRPRRAYFYQSEYNIRMECKDRGDSPEVTEATIVDYRSASIVQ